MSVLRCLGNKTTPKDFQDIIFPFDRVLEVVTFQLPLNFHPIFSYLKLNGLTWDQGGSLLEEIQIYWSTSAGYRNGVLMVVRANDLKCSLMFWINYLVTIEFTFAYPLLFNPPFSTLWASFVQFSFGECEESPRVRVLLEIFERREDLAWVFKIFHPIEVSWVRKTFLSMKT